MEIPDNTLPEYAGNPFIAVLPPVKSGLELYEMLRQAPAWSEQDRARPASLRRHCVPRLKHFYEPLEPHLLLAYQLDLILRQGYIGRNPGTDSYLRHVQAGVERTEAQDLLTPPTRKIDNTAMSFALIGCSGTGKSRTLDMILKPYPQTFQHFDPNPVVQVVWLKIDCPYNGSLAQVCDSFFSALDKLLGTRYLKMYGGKKVGAMQLDMATLANLHAVGVLIIDEIQHLRTRKLADEVLNFLVTMVNTIGVPLVLVGTFSAQGLIQKTLRNSRRAADLGSPVWDRLARGKQWNRFVSRMWVHQYTATATPLDDAMIEALYEESQGILAVVVNLYMIAQIRLINIGEYNPAHPEKITPDLIRSVSKENLSMIQPMLQALRNNDLVALAKYDDLRAFDQVLEEALASMDFQETLLAVESKAGTVADKAAKIEALHPILNALGIEQDLVDRLIDRAVRKAPNADTAKLIQLILQDYNGPDRKPASKGRRAGAKVEPAELPSDDLRHIVASHESKDAYEALRDAGVIRPFNQLLEP